MSVKVEKKKFDAALKKLLAAAPLRRDQVKKPKKKRKN
jgi:hypothetical protein